MGNGNLISIKDESWLPKTGNYKPTWVKRECWGNRAASLIDANGSWKEIEIRDSFCLADAEVILSIPLGSKETKDSILSCLDPKGRFSVKNAYHLAYNLSRAEIESPSNNAGTKMLWKKLWSFKVAPKEKMCTWRALQNSLSTQNNIIFKGIDTNPLCFFCRKKAETVDHVLWECKVAKSVWGFFFPHLIEVFDFFREGEACSEKWDSLMKIPESMYTATVIIWSIWTHRNSVKNNLNHPRFQFYNQISS